MARLCLSWPSCAYQLPISWWRNEARGQREVTLAKPFPPRKKRKNIGNGKCLSSHRSPVYLGPSPTLRFTCQSSGVLYSLSSPDKEQPTLLLFSSFPDGFHVAHVGSQLYRRLVILCICFHLCWAPGLVPRRVAGEESIHIACAIHSI